MKPNDILVKIIDGKWGVVLQNVSDDEKFNKEIIIKMHSKEDAVRYARVCEQRTGKTVLLPN